MVRKGKLTDKENQQIETFIENNPDCAFQLELAREELDEVVYANEIAGQPSSGALDRLLSDIQKEPGASRATKQSSFSLSDIFSIFSPNFASYALPAALAVIIMQAVTLGVVLQKPSESPVSYKTASKKTGEAKLTGSFAFVLFAPDASAKEISDLLNKFNAQIIEGPKPNQMYKVKLAAKKLPTEDVAKIVNSLKGEGKVIKLILPAK